MAVNDGTLVEVRCAWNAWRTAYVRACDLRHLHWFQPSGAPRPLVHAYVACSDIVRGDIPHECDRGGAPHQLLVCVLKRYATPAVYDTLARLAENRLRAGDSKAVPAGR